MSLCLYLRAYRVGNPCGVCVPCRENAREAERCALTAAESEIAALKAERNRLALQHEIIAGPSLDAAVERMQREDLSWMTREAAINHYQVAMAGQFAAFDQRDSAKRERDALKHELDAAGRKITALLRRAEIDAEALAISMRRWHG